MIDNYLNGLLMSSSNLAITGSRLFHLKYFIKLRKSLDQLKQLTWTLRRKDVVSVTDLKKKHKRKQDESKKENIPSRLLTKIEMACFEPAKINPELL